MALLAPFAQFGVLQTPHRAGRRGRDHRQHRGLSRALPAAIAAFLIVAILDIVVAWGLYILLRPTNEPRAPGRVAARRLRRALRLRAAQPARCRAAASRARPRTALQSASPGAGRARRSPRSTTAGTWRSAIFGLHLVGLGALLFRSVDFPKVLGALVALAGVGYLADSFGTILVPDYALDHQRLHVHR